MTDTTPSQEERLPLLTLIEETARWLTSRGDEESLIVAQRLEAALSYGHTRNALTHEEGPLGLRGAMRYYAQMPIASGLRRVLNDAVAVLDDYRLRALLDSDPSPAEPREPLSCPRCGKTFSIVTHYRSVDHHPDGTHTLYADERASPAEPAPLDVARLAQVLRAVDASRPTFQSAGAEWYERWAEAVAREYAATEPERVSEEGTAT